MSDTQHYDEWSAAALAGTYTLISPERIAEMFLWTTRHGPPNCWTGTTGAAAAMIRELLAERLHHKSMLEFVEADTPSEAHHRMGNPQGACGS